jgi:hypothetical protein
MQPHSLLDRAGAPIVQVPSSKSERHQGFGPKLGGGSNQTLADVRQLGTHVVQQEIGVRCELAVRECLNPVIAGPEVG